VSGWTEIGVASDRLRLLAVHAHPDDESSKGAASMARYLAEGADVLVATCTDGAKGSILNEQLKPREAELLPRIIEIRAAEMDRAREILGVRQEFLGFADSGLPAAPEGEVDLPPLDPGSFAMLELETATAPLVELVRRFRPHVITTYDENGGYPHPDHVMTHRVAVEAFEAAGDPARYPGTGEPWQPLKLYYHMTFSKARVEALHAALLEAGEESPYADWLKRWEDKPEDAHRVTTRVECAQWFPVRDAALLAHETQVDPGGPWFRVPMAVQQRIWPTEDYQLAQSRVESPLPEDDLFAGVREQASGDAAA
jgi:mycothiol S-conjugate amidase